MRLSSSTFAHETLIPEYCAFGVPDPDDRMKLGLDRNPQLSWSDIPTGAKSLVLLCVDPDVPSALDNFNQEGKTIAVDLPRVEFVHWVMVDIPADEGAIEEGSCCDGITAGGKTNPPGPAGSRQGINSYTDFMAGNPEMEGDYFGYDGPCPPWNDERLHHYNFTLYAIDLDFCPVPDRFTAAEVRQALAGHILAEAVLTGTYSLNPTLR